MQRPTEKQCPNGHFVMEMHTYCPDCGVKLVEVEARGCPQCGSRSYANKYCTSCGAKIEGEELPRNLKGIKRGLKDISEGKVKPLSQVREDLQFPKDGSPPR